VKHALLDSSFVIDLLNELAAGEEGNAVAWLRRNSRVKLWVSPVTWAEVFEGAEDADAVRAYLGRFAWQGIARAHAERAAIVQRGAARRLGENDAWQVAVAGSMDAAIVGHDPKAFARPGVRYEDHRAKSPS
jgi:predicted nucleic acid-binding protein